MNPFRYVATRAAHEKNPYPVGSSEWDHYNEGFVRSFIPKMPRPWNLAMEAMMVMMMLMPSIVVVSVIILLT